MAVVVPGIVVEGWIFYYSLLFLPFSLSFFVSICLSVCQGSLVRAIKCGSEAQLLCEMLDVVVGIGRIYIGIMSTGFSAAILWR